LFNRRRPTKNYCPSSNRHKTPRRDMTGGDDECRTLSRRVWGRLELTSGRAYQELPEESRGKQASRAPSKRTRAGHEGGLTGLPPSKRTRSAGKAHHERTADPSRITQQFVRLTNPELEFRTSHLFGCGSVGVVKCRQRIGSSGQLRLTLPLNSKRESTHRCELQVPIANNTLLRD